MQSKVSSASLLGSPDAVLPASGLTPPSTPRTAFDRSRSLVTAFRSPATVPRFRGPIPGSTLPACRFASNPESSTARSALLLRRRNPVSPGPGRLIASGPLQLRFQVRSTASPASTPLQDSYIPRDQSVQPDLLPNRLAFRTRPISLRSPQSNLLLVSATDQRSRFATFPEA